MQPSAGSHRCLSIPIRLSTHACGCFRAGSAPGKSSTSAPRCRKCEPGAGEGELSEHAAYTACPEPVDYAHQTTHYFEHHVFYPPSGEWVGRSKAPLPIDISGFSKNQIESGAFRLCARTPYTSVPILQHHIIMMHVTSRMLIQLPGTGIFLPNAIMSR